MGHREWTGQAHIRRAPADAIEAPIRRLTSAAGIDGLIKAFDD
jgi:hypothetical protein